ncbi:MAG: maleylpyruvate isomerase family mycothiol-dependent enzyme [Acidimicrobiia bacterium]|nr:maleylpyruvate isomerase family mycothiol-dependent enzyme [Acidimicrobiia bacterium]
MREILSDLVAEEQSLDQFLQRIHERDWKLPTPATGWSIMDTVCHLAYTETFAAQAISEGQAFVDAADITDIDEWTKRGVEQGRGKRYQEIIEWWRNGRASVVDALSRMDPKDRVPWVYSSASAKAFATLRLMETWAHGLDIKAAMEGRITLAEDEEDPTADTPRIRHIAWLAHRLLPWAFSEAGETYPEQGIRVELMGPRYARYVYGPDDTEQVIKGIAGEWCRVAVHRLDVADTGLKAIGDDAETALQVVRAY